MHTNDTHTLIFFKVGRCGVDTNRRKNEVGKRNRALSRLPFNTCKAHTQLEIEGMQYLITTAECVDEVKKNLRNMPLKGCVILFSLDKSCVKLRARKFLTQLPLPEFLSEYSKLTWNNVNFGNLT